MSDLDMLLCNRNKNDKTCTPWRFLQVLLGDSSGEIPKIDATALLGGIIKFRPIYIDRRNAVATLLLAVSQLYVAST